MLAASAISAGVYLGDRNRVSVGNRCVCVCVCVHLYQWRAVQGTFSTKRIAAGAVWSAVISWRAAETLKVTTAAPLMPVNVTEVQDTKFTPNLCLCFLET